MHNPFIVAVIYVTIYVQWCKSDIIMMQWACTHGKSMKGPCPHDLTKNRKSKKYPPQLCTNYGERSQLPWHICPLFFIYEQVLRSLAPSITIKCTHFCWGIHFLLGHAKWPPLPDCIQYGSPLAESDLMKYANILVGARLGMTAAAALCVVGLVIDVTSIVYNTRQIQIYSKKQLQENSASETNVPENARYSNIIT